MSGRYQSVIRDETNAKIKTLHAKYGDPEQAGTC